MPPRPAIRMFARRPHTAARGLWYLRPLLAVIAMLLLLSGFRAQASEVVRLSNSEWPPYFSETQKHGGIGSHIVSEAFALVGIRVEYQFFPARRALELAKNGTFDGTVGWELNEERSQYLIASDVVWESPWVFFHLVTTPFDWSDLGSLRYHRIGGTVGYMYTPEFREAEAAGIVSLDRGPSDDVGLRKLLAGRYELFPQLREVGYYQIRQLFNPQQQRLFTHHEKPLGSHRDQLLLYRHHPRSQALIDAFNRGLAKLRDSGQLDRYFEALARGEYNLVPDH